MSDKTVQEGKFVALAKLTDPCAPIVYGIVQPGPDLPDGVVFVQSRDVGNKISTSSLNRTSVEIARQYKRSQISHGDILFSLRGNIGQSSMVPRELDGANIARGVARIRVNKTHDAEYIRYALQGPKLQKLISENANGSTFREISIDELRKLPLPIPPLLEQRKIAEILRTWDDAIEKLEALRAAKAQRFDGLRDMLMARGSRDGRPTTFGAFLTESRILGNDGATARKISVRLYGKGAVEKVEQRAGSANTRYYRRKAGQIIWSKLDFLNGAFALLGEELDDCQSTLDLPAFDCAPAVNPLWLIEYLTRPAYYKQQVHLARGQRKARRVAPEDWLASPIRLPDRTDQDRIAEVIGCARRDVETTGRNIEALTRQKRGLMQKLLTGEWRVNLEEVSA